MDLSWDDRRTHQFVTNVGLITSKGPNGPNVMSAEWTHYVSYAPSLIVVNISSKDATAENISASKEFGVNLAAQDHNIICSIAGGNSGHDVDKIAALTDLGVEFYDGKTINVPMINGAAMNAECQVIQETPLGDHTMFVGEVQEILADESVLPLVYHNGKYWKLGDEVAKPPQQERDKIAGLIEKHKKT